MKICVFGLWHLGTVISACLARAGFETIGLDTNRQLIASLKQSHPPVSEPGLSELLQNGLKSKKLNFSDKPVAALNKADVLWIAFDTPVDENDRADTNFVLRKVNQLFKHIPDNCMILVSSQLPVGFTTKLEAHYKKLFPKKNVRCCYVPENLVLGHSIEAFTNPARIIAGTPNGEPYKPLESVLNVFSKNILWMRRESAEMSKHALNAFLATSVTFINEIASLCERVGANASDVEQALKSDERIGIKAYLRPGGAIGGGTLNRDIVFLNGLAKSNRVKLPLLENIQTSNRIHALWTQRHLKKFIPNLVNKKIAILGLTYKAGTDTLRRSTAVALAAWLLNQKAHVSAYDPAIKKIPASLRLKLIPSRSAREAIRGADAVVLHTCWEEFRHLDANFFLSEMKEPIVLDVFGFLKSTIGQNKKIKHLMVGKPVEAL